MSAGVWENEVLSPEHRPDITIPAILTESRRCLPRHLRCITLSAEAHSSLRRTPECQVPPRPWHPPPAPCDKGRRGLLCLIDIKSARLERRTPHRRSHGSQARDLGPPHRQGPQRGAPLPRGCWELKPRPCRPPVHTLPVRAHLSKRVPGPPVSKRISWLTDFH